MVVPTTLDVACGGAGGETAAPSLPVRAVLDGKNLPPSTFNEKPTGKLAGKIGVFWQNGAASAKKVTPGNLGPSPVHPNSKKWNFSNV